MNDNGRENYNFTFRHDIVGHFVEEGNAGHGLLVAERFLDEIPFILFSCLFCALLFLAFVRLDSF